MKAFRFLYLFLIFLGIAAAAQVNPVPLVNQPLVPAAVAPGHSAFTLTVNGTGFVPHSTVYWDGAKRVTQVVSSTRLKAKISAQDVSKPGTASVTVVNPSPGGGASNVVFLPIRGPAPSVGLAPTFNFPGAQTSIAGDFNNDGKQDVAVGVANHDGSGEIDIYLGKGDGTFSGPVKTKSVTNVTKLLAGDFNGDGKLDLAVADGLDNVSIFLNQGGGRMHQSQVFDSEDALAAADFNGDGKLDLVVSYYDGQAQQVYLSICLGSGDGTFGSPQEIAAGVYVGSAPAVGDFNGDGTLDLAVPYYTNSDTYVAVYLGNGDGTFYYSSTYQQPYYGLWAATADVNGDGKLDIITNGVSVFLGNGDGTFTNDGGVDMGVHEAFTVNIGDFNGDGKLDVTTVSGTSTTFNLLLGNGDGTFQAPLQFGSSYGVDNLSIGDFNNDGRLDLVGSSLYLQISASLQPGSLAFGQVNVGQKSQPQTATLTNVGTLDLLIQKIGVNGTDPNDFTQTNNCPSSLPANQSCQIQVIFAPTAGGARSASLFVDYKGLGSPATVALNGTGVDLTVSLTPSSMKFPLQLVNTTSQPQTATLTNTGSDTVTISSISTASPFNQTNNCPSSLQTNSYCQIQVTFTPTSGGKAKGTLYVYDDAQGSPQTVTLSGVGTVVKLTPGSVNFGNQKVGTKSPSFPIEVINEGSNTLSISQVTITGTNAGDFSETNNCKKVSPGAHCDVKVTFQPTAKGKRSAKLDVYDDGGGSPQTAALAGTGT